MRWARLFLVVMLVVDVWYRAHTFAPDIRAATGIDLWPQTVGASEPLDCDEAAYAYMGHRVLKGDVLYRDLTEYKPPLGYWIYMIAVAIGGYNELAIRLLAIPFVMATIASVWWIAIRIGGTVAGCLASALYVLLSTDPYLFGNGSNLEHFINLFSVLSLAMILRGWDREDRRWLVGAGACLGAAAMVKQVAMAHALVFIPAILARAWAVEPRGRRLARGVRDMLAFGLGVAVVVGILLAIVVARGAGRAAYEDIVLQARALATDTLPEPGAPSSWIRWLTGNADPKGHLPWPFGSTDWLVWWGAGSWPLWLASVPAMAYLLAGRADAGRRLAAGWTLAAWLQIALPGLYWQHYYLLPVPGVAIVVAVALADAVAAVARRTRIIPAALGAIVLMLAIGWAMALQARCYLGVAPQELTTRYKGGGQWVALRELGRVVSRRTSEWRGPHLYIWGWQSPLYFYARLDSPTRHFFVDNLLRDQAGRDHPLIGPRVDEIMATLRARPPELIFAGYAPFPALRAFLSENYRLSPRIPHFPPIPLWIRRDRLGDFVAAGDR